MIIKRKIISRAGVVLFALLVLLLAGVSCRKKEQVAVSYKMEEASDQEEHRHKEAEKKVEKKKLYTCSMHPEYVTDKPGDCPICGMTLVPVEEEEALPMEMPQGTIRITPEKQQLIGVTFGNVEYRELGKKIRTVGRLTYDETRITDINTKFSGWVEKLYVDFSGQLVRQGQPLFSIYSPELVSTQEEYLLALRARGTFASTAYSEVKTGAETLVEAARRKLAYWDITEEQVKELERTQKPLKSMVFHAPFAGFVVEKNIVQGKFVMAGEKLYQLANISIIWVLADIYEYELAGIAQGQQAEVELSYFPGSRFLGKISYVYPYLETETRTVKVRVELPNKDFRLKPEMYGTIDIQVDLGRRLTLPEGALIDSGTRKIVFLDRGEGYFEPREVKVGQKVGGYYEALEGVEEGARVVTSANFLIDSESRLKSAIRETHKH